MAYTPAGKIGGKAAPGITMVTVLAPGTILADIGIGIFNPNEVISAVAPVTVYSASDYPVTVTEASFPNYIGYG